MTKTLSEQLCEVVELEIPGKLVFSKRNWDKKTYICSGRGYKEFDFKSQPEVYVDIIPTKQWNEQNGFQYPYSEIENIKKIYDEHGYVFIKIQTKRLDFEQPENFVKLFNLELANTQGARLTLATFITKKFELTVDSRHFISQVMRLIQYALYYQVDGELIKQSIRDYEGWVWG